MLPDESGIAQQETEKLPGLLLLPPSAEFAASEPVPVTELLTSPTASCEPLEAAAVVAMFNGAVPKSRSDWLALYGPTGSSHG